MWGPPPSLPASRWRFSSSWLSGRRERRKEKDNTDNLRWCAGLTQCLSNCTDNLQIENSLSQQRTMIFGRVAYLGVLSRRSAVITAGMLIFMVSSPPSISRTTLSWFPSIDTSDAKVPCDTTTVLYQNTSSIAAKPFPPIHAERAPSPGQALKCHLKR